MSTQKSDEPVTKKESCDESYVLEGEEMWAMRVIDEHLMSETSSQNQADTSSEDAE